MRANMSDRLWLAAIMALAAVLLLMGSWFNYTSTFDTGTVGLMSVNIVQGDRPLFFYGQPYFGALEAYVAAIFIGLFGFSEFIISLSPISFTLAWIIFSYLLFSRIHNGTAGLIAAACTAFPGYYVFWYSIATYGGYPVIFCIGTAMLWLSLRVWQENVANISLACHAACIGSLMAIGIWVHPLTFPYIAVAACILGMFCRREHCRTDIVISLGLIVIIALSGFVPFYLETGSFLGGISNRVQLSWAHIASALSNLLTVNIVELIVWNFTHIFGLPLIKYLIISTISLVLFSVFLLAVYSVATSEKIKIKNYLLPVLFCLFFLLMYVQHHMATIQAPRYAIGFWGMLLCVLWSLAIAGQTKRRLKIIASVLFGIWLVYQVTGTVLFIAYGADQARLEKRIASDVVSAARKNNLKSVVLYGDLFFGLKGQKFSMYSQNMIVFTHADTERYQPNAQFAETDLHRGYLATAKAKISLENTLNKLGVKFTVEQVHDYFLFSPLHFKPQLAMQAIPSEEVVHLSLSDHEEIDMADGLQDHSQDIDFDLEVPTTGTVRSFDTGQIRKFCALWMLTWQDPAAHKWNGPGRYEIHVSLDGIHYDKVYSPLSIVGNGFHAGPGTYVGGPWGKVETLFEPVLARYVRVIFLEENSSPLTKFLFFQTDGSLREDDPDDIAELSRLISDQNIDFVLADRWVSARLREVFKGGSKQEIALPRHSNRYKNKLLDHFVKPAPGQALICDAAIADECEKVIKKQYGPAVIFTRFDVHNYSLFSFVASELHYDLSAPSALLWNGHFPLPTQDMGVLAPWLNDLGLPVWSKNFVRTKGMSHDSWTNGDAIFYDLDYTIKPGKDRELLLYTYGWRATPEMSSLNLKLTANNRILLPFKDKKQNTYIFAIPANLTSIKNIRIQSTTFVPSGKDTRKLGIDIERIEIQ